MITRLMSQQFAKIKTAEILPRSYEQLVDLVAKRYSNPQFKHANTAALYQIQHHHNIISSGDYVLDIGAGPHFRWTDLALTLAQNQSFSHKVVSNDKQSLGISRSNHAFVKGNFLQEQVRTNIALALGQQNQFDAVLTDISPPFTGQLEDDGFDLISNIHQIMSFNSTFLKKGGNFVCKVLHSSSTELFRQKAKIFFHESFYFKPSVIRTNSPVHFIVLKGFGMNHNLDAMRQFLRRYKGSPKNKIQVVKNYQEKYDWDPVKVLQDRVKDQYFNLKAQGRSARQIEIMFKDDPFIKIGPIAKMAQKIQKAKNDDDELALKKALHEYTEGKLYKEDAKVPNSREEWIDFLEDIENKLKKPKKQKKRQQNLEPLGDNQIYMKGNPKVEEEEKPYVYIEQDLIGEYHVKFEEQHIDRQIAKINKALKLQGKKEIKRDTKLDLKEVFGWKREDEMDPEQQVRQMVENLQAISDEDFYEMERNEGLRYDKAHQVGQNSKGDTKFKNR